MTERPAFTGCEKCLDTGWAHVPHSDESREVCDCPAGRRVAAYMEAQHKAQGAFARMAPDFPFFPKTVPPIIYHRLGTDSLEGDELELQGWSTPHYETIGPPIHIRRRDVDDHRADALRYAVMGLAGQPSGVEVDWWWFGELEDTADLTWVPVITMAMITFGLPALLAVLL